MSGRELLSLLMEADCLHVDRFPGQSQVVTGFNNKHVGVHPVNLVVVAPFMLCYGRAGTI